MEGVGVMRERELKLSVPGPNGFGDATLREGKQTPELITVLCATPGQLQKDQSNTSERGLILFLSLFLSLLKRMKEWIVEW